MSKKTSASDTPSGELEEATRLFSLAAEIAQVTTRSEDSAARWEGEIMDAQDAALVRLLSKLARSRQTAPFSDAVRATLDLRISERGLASMERLERSAHKLALVGVGVGIIGVIATFAQGCSTN